MNFMKKLIAIFTVLSLISCKKEVQTFSKNITIIQDTVQNLKIKNIKEKDEFSKLVKQKLENHQLPVSDDIWAGIEQKMSAPAPQKRRIVPWYWFAGAAAAAPAAGR